MSRLMIAIRGGGLLAATVLTIMTLRAIADTLLHGGGPGWGFELASSGCACAALFVLNAALLGSSPSAGVVRLVIAHVVLTPFAAFFCYAGCVDPVALFIALPLVAGVVVTLGASACPVRRLAGMR